MKKIITFLLIIIMTGFCYGVLAQTSFIVYDEQDNVINNGSNVSLTTIVGGTAVYKVKIKNNSASAVTARIYKTIVSEVEGSSNTICSPITNAGGGSCSMGARTAPFTLAAGELSGFAELDFNQGSNAGTSVITYKIVNDNDENDNVSFTVNFSTESSSNMNSVNNFLVYPNPASTNFTIQYDFGPSSYVEVYNVLGKVVAQINPRSAKSSVNIDCSKWEKGYYFCRLYNENKVEKTVKLVVVR
ncbi:MAG: T9SS type A sorting domain-containing protein [Bacteroidales bacterium]|jgi:hypothetical protein|nr:T9SS type A sorting domain-containing protein [Bacteroidales bacterium]